MSKQDDLTTLRAEVHRLTEALSDERDSHASCERALALADDQLAEARATLEHLRNLKATLFDGHELISAREISAKIDIADLKAALRTYGQHHYDCRVQNTHEVPTCDCGFIAALTTIKVTR